ncbi:MAG: Uma2 family endonuclease [Cyanobacteria bacterium J06639_14]
MVLLDSLATHLSLTDSEERRTLSDVSWWQYQTLLNDLGEASPYRVHYLKGILEIVAPSRRHESSKTRIGDLLLIYFLETNTEYFPMGSTTLHEESQQAGGEPDESYCIVTDKAIPDLAIEVVITRGGINRLELYRRLGVLEVWFWQHNVFSLYRLRPERLDQLAATYGYEAIAGSELLPALDIALLTQCVQNPSPLAAAQAFRQGIQANHP